MTPANIDTFSCYVEAVAKDAGISFTLDGEPVTARDLADPKGLLPLIVAATNLLRREISDIKQSTLQLLEPAEPSEHLLGWKVVQLPELSTGVMRLLVNHCIREHLSTPPRAGLYNPTLPPEPKLAVCELRPHLDAMDLSQQKDLSSPTPGF